MTGDKRESENELESPRPTKRIRLEEWLSDVGSESEVESIASVTASNSLPSLKPPTTVFSSTTVQRFPSPPVGRTTLFPSTEPRKPAESDWKSPESLPQNELRVPLSNKIQSFADLGVSRQIASALAAMSIRRPTEVQAACIPPLIAGNAPHASPVHCLLLAPGRDCIGNAKTGSGKTVAFAVPIIQKLAQDPYGIFALILTPTRWVPAMRSRHPCE